MSRSSLAHAALAVLLVPGLAAAHGVDTEVARRGAEIAVRARYTGGEPLAGAHFEVFAPARADEPFARGRTDRDGWLVFAPGAPGTWKVRVVDATGHGQVVDVEVAPALPAADRAEEARPAPVSPTAPAPPLPSPPAGSASGLALGVAIIALVFGGLWVAGRRRRAPGR
jgi:nickel transport protein